MKKYIKVISIGIFVMTIIAVGIMSYLSLDGISVNILSNEIPFDMISDVAKTSDGIALIDESNKRLVWIDSDNRVKKIFNGGGKDFDIATGVTLDEEGNIYLSNIQYDEDAANVIKEEIIRFNKSFDKKVLLTKEYQPGEANYTGNIISLQIDKHNNLTFFDVFNDTVQFVQMDADSGQIIDSKSIVMEEGFNYRLLNIKKCGENSFIYSNSKGEVVIDDFDTGESKVLFSSAQLEKEGKKIIPTFIEVKDSVKNSVYFVDTVSKSIKLFDNGEIHDVVDKTVISEGENAGWSGYSRFKYLGFGNIITFCESHFLEYSDGQKVQDMPHARLSNKYISIRIMFFTAFMLLVLIICIIAYIVIVRDKLFSKLSSLSRRIILLVSGIIIATTICGFYTAYVFVNYFENMLSTTLTNAATLATMSYDGEIIDQFHSIEQSDSEEYNDFFNMAAEQFSDFDDTWSSRYYIGFTTIRDNSMYVLFYSDGTSSLFTPLSWELESAFGDPYRKVDETRETLLKQMIDYQGKWLYGIAPVVRKDNSIAGYSEIGTYAGIFRNQVIRTAVSSIYMLLGLIAVLIFFFIEITFAFEILSTKRTDTPWYEKFGLKYERKIIRIPAFLIYTIINIPLYLFPIIMKDMCKDGFLGMSTDIAISLPLSFNMLGTLLASFCSARIVKKIGWQKGVLSGVSLIAISYLLCAFVYEPITFTLIAFSVGFGTGISYISMYDFVRLSGKYSKDQDGDSSTEEEEQNTEYISIINAGMFAGANCGVVFGTMVYTSFGFSISFLVAAIMAILTGVFIYFFMPNIMDTALESEAQHKPIGTAKFVLNPEVWLFSLLILIPVSISYFFVLHFVPVYFDIQGASPDLASLVFLLNGLIVIYFGPMLTRTMMKKIGLQLSAVASSLLVAIPFIIFVIYPNIYMTILVAVAIGLTEGFGQSTRIDYFANLPISKQYGESEAVGIYNTIEGIGQIIAPTIFGYIILIGPSKGMMIFTGIIIAATAVYMATKFLNKTGSMRRRSLDIN